MLSSYFIRIFTVMNSNWRIIALNPDKKIGGVWRLKDDKKFYLGDSTSFGYIVEFSVRSGYMWAKCGGSKVYGIPELRRFEYVLLEALS